MVLDVNGRHRTFFVAKVKPHKRPAVNYEQPSRPDSTQIQNANAPDYGANIDDASIIGPAAVAANTFFMGLHGNFKDLKR